MGAPQEGLNHSTKAIKMRQRYSISKDDLLARITASLLIDKPLAATYDILQFAFGFERKDGLEIALTQLIFPSKTEEAICTLPFYKTIENIDNWCRENGIAGYFDYQKDTYFFTGFLPKVN